MAIPTVSGTYGKKEGIMEWENLDDTEKQYLVQIAPPGYTITQVVRDIAAHQNMTTTGVLFDESIGKLSFQKFQIFIQMLLISF